MERRDFLLKTAGAVLATGAAAAGCGEKPASEKGPQVIPRRHFEWRMVTSWTPGLDVLLGNARRFASLVEAMSDGQLKIKVYAAGELVPGTGVFDACQQGTIEMFNSASYYWAGTEPATQWFTAVPFGLNAEGQYAWLYSGGGLKLWEETYAPFGLLPRPAASTGVQMAGWFRKRINSLADYRGLRMRIPGLGGRVIAEAGAAVVMLSPADVYLALERGNIDAAEMVGPHDDVKLGLNKTARYYYYPGWHEPGSVTEFTFNRKAYDALPKELQRMLDQAALSIKSLGSAEYDVKNAAALRRLRTEFKDDVEILPLPADVLKGLKGLAEKVNREESEKSPIARKVYASYTQFQGLLRDWGTISERPYYEFIAS